MNPSRFYVDAPRQAQGYIGSFRPSDLRQIVAATTRGLGFFYFVGFAIGCKAYINNKAAESDHDVAQFEASVESNDWKCYNTMRLYNVECSHLDPYVEEDNEVCQTLQNVIKKCENYVYRYINVPVTPAMKPPTYLFNRPEWLK